MKEYKAIQRTTRHTSGHEVEELDAILNTMGKDGWRFIYAIQQTMTSQILVFERDSRT